MDNLDIMDFDYWSDRHDDEWQNEYPQRYHHDHQYTPIHEYRHDHPSKPLVNQKPSKQKANSMANVSEKPPVSFKKLKSEYEDGQAVMCIAGTITALYAPKKGDTYEYQNGKMKDAEGTEMEISISKNTQPLTAKGKKVTIRSIKHEQHGWLGIKVEDQEFEKNGEQVSKRVLKLTGSAEFTYQDGGGSESSSKPSSNGGGGASKPSSYDERHPELVLADITAFHQRCRFYAAQAYTIGAAPGNVTEEEFQAYVSSIFIEGCRQGAQNNYQERSLKPVPPKITPAPTPDKWKECMIPKGSLAGKTLGDLDDEQLRAFYDAIMEGKNPNTPFGKCVQEGAKERNLIVASDDSALSPEEDGDGIPF